MSEATQLYKDALLSIQNGTPLKREEKTVPENCIVATHGPALAKAVRDNPGILDFIGIYRVNCSHIGKEPDLHALAEYLRGIHKYVPILIDLQ